MLYSFFLVYGDIEVIKLFLPNIILKNIESISSIQLPLKLFSCFFFFFFSLNRVINGGSCKQTTSLN
jgi:hypothetical protein